MSSFDLIWRLIVLLLIKNSNTYDDQKADDYNKSNLEVVP